MSNPTNLTATETEILAPSVTTDAPLETVVETQHELTQPQPKKTEGQVGLPFLLEIGTEEVPDWMISTALETARSGNSSASTERKPISRSSWPR